MDKYDIIDKISNDLSNLAVNILHTVQNLAVLKDGLKKEDELRRKAEQPEKEENSDE